VARKLVKLSIKETSGVDHPAHLTEGWVIMKSADATSELTAVLDELRPSSEAPTTEPVAKSDDEAVVIEPEIVISELPVEGNLEVPNTASDDVVKTQSPQEDKLMSDATEVVVIPGEATDEEIIKAMPAQIRKMLDDSAATAELALRKAAASEAALVAEREARADEAAVLKAAEWSHLNIDPTIVGPALRRLSENDGTLAGEIVKALDSANALLESNVVFTEVGTDAPVAADDAFSKMESLAKAAVASGTAPSFESALMAVAQSNPDLYTAYLNEKGR